MGSDSSVLFSVVFYKSTKRGGPNHLTQRRAIIRQDQTFKRKDPTMAHIMPTSSVKESINFDTLLLVEKPDSALNSSFLPHTLEDCEGYLQSLPLKSPNADSKIPSTVAK